MNILLDYLPETVNVCGREYSIDTNFRTCIIYEQILADKGLTSKEKVLCTVELFFGEVNDEMPTDIEAAFNAIQTIYLCGAVAKKNTGVKRNGNVVVKKKPVLDYIIDANLIFAAFLTQYGIDLNSIEYLHWWKFQALLNGLERHNKIVEIMEYRAADLGKIKDPKERERIASLQRIYALPDTFTSEEHIANAGMAFAGGL